MSIEGMENEEFLRKKIKDDLHYVTEAIACYERQKLSLEEVIKMYKIDVVKLEGKIEALEEIKRHIEVAK